MNYSNSSNDTVLQLSVGKSNSGHKKQTNLKRYIIRWLKGLKTLTIQKKVIYFLIIMVSCFILYPNYHNRMLHDKNEGNKDLDLEEIINSNEKFHDPALKNIMKRRAHADKIKQMKQKYV